MGNFILLVSQRTTMISYNVAGQSQWIKAFMWNWNLLCLMSSIIQTVHMTTWRSSSKARYWVHTVAPRRKDIPKRYLTWNLQLIISRLCFIRIIQMRKSLEDLKHITEQLVCYIYTHTQTRDCGYMHLQSQIINNSWVDEPTILLYFAYMIILDILWSILIQSLDRIKINSVLGQDQN